jgi:hypothetical protein
MDGITHVVGISSIKNTVAFERHFNVSAQVLSMSPRVEYIAFMAYSAASAAGIDVPDTFDGFLDKLDDISVVDEADTDPNPTDGGQSAEL